MSERFISQNPGDWASVPHAELEDLKEVPDQVEHNPSPKNNKSMKEQVSEIVSRIERYLGINKGGNCGTGKGGFKQGNKCAVGGKGSKDDTWDHGLNGIKLLTKEDKDLLQKFSKFGLEHRLSEKVGKTTVEHTLGFEWDHDEQYDFVFKGGIKSGKWSNSYGYIKGTGGLPGMLKAVDRDLKNPEKAKTLDLIALGLAIANPIDKSIRPAVVNYTDSSSTINRQMRQGKASKKYLDMNKACKKKLPRPMTVYRGIGESGLNHLLDSKSKYLYSGGMSSTSLDPETSTNFGYAVGITDYDYDTDRNKSNKLGQKIAKRFGLKDLKSEELHPILKIEAKTGLYVAHVSSHPHERELIQAHNTKYRVVKAELAEFDSEKFRPKKNPGYSGHLLIHLEEV